MSDSKHRVHGDLFFISLVQAKCKIRWLNRKKTVRPKSLSFYLTFALLSPLKVDNLKVPAGLNRVLPEWLIWHKHTALGVISQVATTWLTTKKDLIVTIPAVHSEPNTMTLPISPVKYQVVYA